MDIRHFRYFLAVARHKSFSRAADQLGIAPPTLTRQIQGLERALDTRLIVRKHREIDLTEAGKSLLVEAALAVRQFETAQLSAQRAGRGETGHIQVGYVASAVFSGVLQTQTEAFRSIYPEIGFSFTERVMSALPALIEQGKVDIGYVRFPVALSDSLERVDLAAEAFVLAVESGSWLLRLKEITAAHLKNETFILPEQISGTFEIAAQGGFSPTLGPQPGGLVSVLALVSLGQGIAMVPESVKRCVSLPNVVYRPVQDCRPRSSLSLVYRRFEKAVAVSRFIAYAKNREAAEQISRI